MKTGTATDQMAVNYETQCKHRLIAKTYRRYAPKTTDQGVYHNKVWSCTEFARLLHKIRSFFLGQMNVLWWIPSKSKYMIRWCNLFQLHSIPHFGCWALLGILIIAYKEFGQPILVGLLHHTHSPGAIPLLLAASTLSCWMSTLARIELPQTNLATHNWSVEDT